MKTEMTTQQAITLYEAIEALTKQFDRENGWDDNVMERVAQLIAHRAVGNQEQDPQNGKLAGYCVVCQVPWPCDTAKPKMFAKVLNDKLNRVRSTI
jgi:hypothetical protein